MRTTCLINNYNYRPYVVEAVESALHQTRPFDQILVVDDGSTDGSGQLLNERFGRTPRLQVLGKPNGGQLSAFNAAIGQVTGDLLFFLDADDRYRANCLERAIDCYERTGADFVIVGLENFGPGVRPSQQRPGERDLGFSVLTTMFAGTWVGGPTSSLSMRTSVARRVLPYPHEEEWRIRADNILVYGASLVGAHKYRLGETLVDRRVHGANLYYGNQLDQRTFVRNSLALNRLVEWYTQQMGYGVADLPRLLTREFRTLERPSSKEFRRYLRLTWTLRQPFVTRIKQTMSLSGHMVTSRLARAKPVADSPSASQPLRRAA